MKTIQYNNVFGEIGISAEETASRLEEIRKTFFYGAPEERIYFPTDDGMAYIEDTGNSDVRTEGMSYGMML